MNPNDPKYTDRNRTCLICSKHFRVPMNVLKLGKGKCCSRACADLYRKSIKPHNDTHTQISCKTCSKVFIASPSDRRIFCSAKCYSKGRKKEEKASRWRGDQVGYMGLHLWVVRHLGKPDTCEHCGTTGLHGRAIHWANKSQEYKRDLDDWLRLCSSCHKKYDMTPKRKEELIYQLEAWRYKYIYGQ